MSLILSYSASAAASGLSGMRAAQRNLDTSAHNIANLQTPGFQRQNVAQTAQPGLGGVNAEVRQQPSAASQPSGNALAHLADDVVAQSVSLYSFAANLKTLRTQDHMLGTLLNTSA
jgi:flagellar hook-associated protein FlgK